MQKYNKFLNCANFLARNLSTIYKSYPKQNLKSLIYSILQFLQCWKVFQNKKPTSLPCFPSCFTSQLHKKPEKSRDQSCIAKKNLSFLHDASTRSIGTIHGSLALIGLLPCFTPWHFSVFITNWFIVVYKHVIGLKTDSSQSNLGGNTDSNHLISGDLCHFLFSFLLMVYYSVLFPAVFHGFLSSFLRHRMPAFLCSVPLPVSRPLFLFCRMLSGLFVCLFPGIGCRCSSPSMER